MMLLEINIELDKQTENAADEPKPAPIGIADWTMKVKPLRLW